MTHGTHVDPVQHLNDNHADDLLAAARTLGGHPDAISVRAERVDRTGIDLRVDTSDGQVAGRVSFAEPVPEGEPAGLQAAFAEVTRRARAALGGDATESST